MVKMIKRSCWRCWSYDLKQSDAINKTTWIKDTYVCQKCTNLNF